MLLVVYLLSFGICFLLWLLIRSAQKLAQRAEEERIRLAQGSVLRWPTVGLIVPVCGEDARILPSLTSLLSQHYPVGSLYPVFVTETSREPAALLIERLRSQFPHLSHVVAGRAHGCGQKNHNLLQGIRALGKVRPDCYVFCDSTHLARPDFLHSLLYPIATGQSRVATGYHEVHPDQSLTSLGYCISVLFMRLLQALSAFTQPWGGAMAIARTTFEQAGIAELWQRTVVDDCALVPHLRRARIPVTLSANALLTTSAKEHAQSVWEAWMERQILFPRFCVPEQWLLLGVMLILFFLPPFFCLEDFCLTLRQGISWRLLLPIGWFGLFLSLSLALKKHVPVKVPPLRYLLAFFLALWTFLRVYLGTLLPQPIRWHGRAYRVGRGGVVLGEEEL